MVVAPFERALSKNHTATKSTMLNVLVLPLLGNFVFIGSPDAAPKDIAYLETILGNHNINAFAVPVHANNLALTKLPAGRVFHLFANTEWHVGTN